MHETRCSVLVHWDEPEAWDGEGSGRGASDWGSHGHPWLIHVNVWQKPLQYCNVISLKSKQMNLEKRTQKKKNGKKGQHTQGVFHFY